MNHVSVALKEALKRINKHASGANKANAKHKRKMRELFNDQNMFDSPERRHAKT